MATTAEPSPTRRQNSQGSPSELLNLLDTDGAHPYTDVTGRLAAVRTPRLSNKPEEEKVNGKESEETREEGPKENDEVVPAAKEFLLERRLESIEAPFFWYAAQVRQLGGESPVHNLMETSGPPEPPYAHPACTVVWEGRAGDR